MAVTLDELSTEDQKLFGELIRREWQTNNSLQVCGRWGIYLALSDQGTTILHNMEDDSIHSCLNLEVVRGYYQRENL
jgi:hypothetical protein